VITGIIVALPEEVSTLTAKKLAKGDVEFLDAQHVLIYSGTGSTNARAAAGKLMDLGATRLISGGCAAGINPALTPGDLMLPLSLLNAAQESLPVDLAWHSHAARHLEVGARFQGCLLESETIVSLSSEKLALFQQTCAQALDMESFAVAKTAAEHQLPFLVVRAIADPAQFDLPAAVAYALNEKGEVSLVKLLKFLIFHPDQIPGLIILGLNFHKAKHSLTKAAKNLAAITAFDTASAEKSAAAAI